jgi:Mrp family chromosome partitioning ATPase
MVREFLSNHAFRSFVDHTGTVIVSTPQDVALADVRKGIAAFRKLSIPVYFPFFHYFFV